MNDCIFCKIAKGEIPADVVFEDDNVLAFRDIHPQAPVHVLLIPKKHLVPAKGLAAEDARVVADIFQAARAVAEGEGVFESGYRLIANMGPDAGQEIEHLHFHLLGGKKLGALVSASS